MKNLNIVPLHGVTKHNPITVPPTTSGKPIPLSELFENIPYFLDSAINYILSDFDYEANITANTAIAIRILAAASDRLSTALETVHVESK